MYSDYSALKIATYARKSSESDERQVESIDDQVAELTKLAKDCGVPINRQYSEAKSAKIPDSREVFRAMLDDIEAGLVDAIFCWHVDRLSRNPIDSGRISWLLQTEQLKIIKTPYREYRPEDNVILFAVDSSGANQQIIELSRNVRRGLRRKAERGIYPLRPRPGYKSVEIIIDGRIRHTIAVDKKRFDLVQRAWHLMLTGSYTGVQVMEALNSWGYLSPRTRQGKGGLPMSRATMYAIFKDPLYYGAFNYLGEVRQGRHRPMITKAAFDEVQRILGRENGIQPQKHEFPFTGLIRCGVCKCFLTAEVHVKTYKTTGNTRAYTYYHCGNKLGCRKSVTGHYVEGQIAEFLRRIRIDQEASNYFVDVLMRNLEQSPLLGPDIVKPKEEALRRERDRLQVLFEMRQNNEISAAEFVPRKNKHSQLITDLGIGIKELKENRERIQRGIQNGCDLLSSGYKRFMVGGVREKRQVATVLACEYKLSNGELLITPNVLLDQIRSIEPPHNGDNMVQKRPAVVMSPAMSAWRDYIRTLLAEGREIFPKLPEFVSITDPGGDNGST